MPHVLRFTVHCFCSKLHRALHFALCRHVCLCLESRVGLFAQAEGSLSIRSHSRVTLTVEGGQSGRSLLGLAPAQRLYQQGLEGARRGRDAHRALVDVFDGEAAAQHLDEHLPELPGREVVEERVEDGAQVEEGVGHGMEGDVAPEEGSGPAGLGHGGHHEATNLVGKPAHHQRPHDET